MALKNIIGQERALGMLRGCITKNRLAHAYLFTGDAGIGKRLTAVNFAKALNCRERVMSYELGVKREKQNSELRTPDSELIIDCCDECPSCIKIDKAIHPDVFFIAPEGDGGQITIKIIRELEEHLSYKSFEGRWKVAVIDIAENLNQSAANAFLKTLEEPPAHSLLILISSRPELIPDTIRSRCQTVRFSPLPLEKMTELLKQETQDTNHKLRSLLSAGRLGDALSEDMIGRRDDSLDMLKSLRGNIEGASWADRDSMEEWFEWAQLWLRDIAVFKAADNTGLLINYDKEAEIKNISQHADLREILALSDKLNDIKDRLRFNLNKELTFYHTSILLKESLGYSL
ncbi:MAG: DNA polymerase III subunit [Nitrospirae bacterium]|nr:DNA polymerase III subunit [Nitrospirota bacterium]MBI4839137.1 DNA polymerase III subunit [Nitrospirota bacterium]